MRRTSLWLATVLIVSTVTLRGAGNDPSRWSDERLAARLVGIAFAGSVLPPDTASWIRDRGVGAIVLYRANTENGDLVPLLRAIRAVVPHGEGGPILAIDQEGGGVIRYAPATIPSAMAIAAAGSEDLAREAGRRVGCALRAAGITMNLAPVADLATAADASGLGTRAFAGTPDRVGAMASAYMRGLREAGVRATAKHFPGQGWASADPHHGPSRVTRSRETLAREDLAPFRALIGAGVDAIMPAHVAYPEWPGAGEEPATFSSPLLWALRRDLGFRGVIVTDAMNMAGTGETDAGRAALRAIEAGADLILTNGSRDAGFAWSAIVRALRDGTLARGRAVESAKRVLLAARPLAPEASGPCADDPRVAGRVASMAVTEIRKAKASPSIAGAVFAGSAGPLGDSFPAERRIAVPVTPSPAQVEPLARQIAAGGARVVAAIQNRGQAAVVARARELAPRMDLTLVVLGSPGDAASIRAGRYIFSYGFLGLEQRAALEVLRGTACAPGRLPLDVPGIATVGEGDVRCVSSGARESR